MLESRRVADKAVAMKKRTIPFSINSCLRHMVR